MEGEDGAAALDGESETETSDDRDKEVEEGEEEDRSDEGCERGCFFFFLPSEGVLPPACSPDFCPAAVLPREMVLPLVLLQLLAVRAFRFQDGECFAGIVFDKEEKGRLFRFGVEGVRT